ncbi:uncharacterized protein J3D65DRAFT_143566 [Phyllosticta citribraziliensis]|uniref:Uncharacterized protein n=1 Tax=Phyllosticta citribraziliensis TaxID=989973 RepID=A0ABR1L6U9_9PEZI
MMGMQLHTTTTIYWRKTPCLPSGGLEGRRKHPSHRRRALRCVASCGVIFTNLMPSRGKEGGSMGVCVYAGMGRAGENHPRLLPLPLRCSVAYQHEASLLSTKQQMYVSALVWQRTWWSIRLLLHTAAVRAGREQPFLVHHGAQKARSIISSLATPHRFLFILSAALLVNFSSIGSAFSTLFRFLCFVRRRLGLPARYSACSALLSFHPTARSLQPHLVFNTCKAQPSTHPPIHPSSTVPVYPMHCTHRPLKRAVAIGLASPPQGKNMLDFNPYQSFINRRAARR